MALHDRAVALASVCAQRRPDRERPRPPGHLRAQVPQFGFGSSRSGRYARAAAEHGRQQRRVAHEREPRLVRHVQPLVAVGDRRVGPLEPFDEMRGARRTPRRTGRRRRRRAATRRSARRGRPSRQRIEVAGVHLAGARDHDRRRAVERRAAHARAPRGRGGRPRRGRACARSTRPTPSIASALTSLGCTYPDPKTGIAGRPAEPCSSMSTPCCSAHHRRAHASAVKFAIVAPVVSTPPHAVGSPKSSFSHRSDDELELRRRAATPPTRPGSGRAPSRASRRRAPRA